MKLLPAKCHERATLRKLWSQTGNSSLSTAKCWPLMPDVVAGFSPRVSKFAFALFWYITNHLMTGPFGNSEFCFPRISMFPSISSQETLRFSRNKIHCSPWDQSSSVKCCMDNLTIFKVGATTPNRSQHIVTYSNRVAKRPQNVAPKNVALIVSIVWPGF